MTGIRKVEGNEIKSFVELLANAYPTRVARTADNLAMTGFQLLERLACDAGQSVQGFYRDGRMIGGMIIYDYLLTYRQSRLLIGGVGSVAVDLLHKKEKVCREMIRFFLQQARRKHQPLVALYSFRPDFYKSLGFGFGSKHSEYNIAPSAFPARGKKSCRLLALEDAEELAACYNNCARVRHGMLARSPAAFKTLLNDPEQRVIGYDAGSGLQGFLSFNFSQRAEKHFLVYDLVVEDLVYQDSETLLGLLAFLRSQSDQVQRVILYSQEENFHHLLQDPRDSSGDIMPVLAHASHREGVGIMYRVSDAAQFFRAMHSQSFGDQSCRLRLMLEDDFLPENEEPLTICFEQGRPRLAPQEKAEVELKIGVAEFSSLLMGVIDFRTLQRYGLAGLSDDAYSDVIQRLFLTEEKPLCNTRF